MAIVGIVQDFLYPILQCPNEAHSSDRDATGSQLRTSSIRARPCPAGLQADRTTTDSERIVARLSYCLYIFMGIVSLRVLEGLGFRVWGLGFRV